MYFLFRVKTKLGICGMLSDKKLSIAGGEQLLNLYRLLPQVRHIQNVARSIKIRRYGTSDNEIINYQYKSNCLKKPL